MGVRIDYAWHGNDFGARRFSAGMACPSRDCTWCRFTVFNYARLECNAYMGSQTSRGNGGWINSGRLLPRWDSFECCSLSGQSESGIISKHNLVLNLSGGAVDALVDLFVCRALPADRPLGLTEEYIDNCTYTACMV